MPKKSNTLKIVIVAAVVVLAAIGTLVYLRETQKPQEIMLAGTLEARTVEVGSLVGGRVARVHVDEGSNVVAGQLLVELETETIDRQIAEQEAAIATARAALAKGIAGPLRVEISKAEAVAQNAERERERQASLFRQGIVSKEVLDAAVTTAKTSADDLNLLRQGTRKEDIDALRAELEQQQRRLATLQKQKAECNVMSSVSGIVQSFGMRPGDLVAPNQTVAEILESSQLWVRVYVPETELFLVHVNAPVKVSVDTIPRQWITGHVASVNPQGEYTPRNIQTPTQRAEQVYGVKVLVDPSPGLKAGMAAQVDLGVKGRPE